MYHAFVELSNKNMDKNYSRQHIKGWMDRKNKDKKPRAMTMLTKTNCPDNFFVRTTFLSDQFFCPDNFFVRTIFLSGQLFCQDNFFVRTIFLSGQFFCLDNFLSGQFFCPDNFFVRTIFCPDNFFVRTIFLTGQKGIYHQVEFCQYCLHQSFLYIVLK